VVEVATFEQLSALGKAIMAAVVEAEMLGLYAVRPDLDRAFDQVVVEARRLEREMEEGDRVELLVKTGEVLVGS